MDDAVHHIASTMDYALLDLRTQSPQAALEHFALQWPELTAGWPREEDYTLTPPDSERHLLVCGGPDSNDVFWRWLAGESLLYAGYALPLSGSPRCVVVPDSASVIAAATSDHAAGYRLTEYFGAAGRFDTIE